MSRLSKKVGGALEHEQSFAHGEVVVREGDHGNEMFVVQSGAVVVVREVGGREVELAQLGKGSFFGEMSVLESLPRDATVRAVGPTTLLTIGPGALLLRLRRDPSFAVEMLNKLSGRIRVLNTRLDEALGDRVDREPTTLL